MVLLGRRGFWNCRPNLFEMSSSDVKVSGPSSFKWWTFVLLFLPLIFRTIFQTLFFGVWEFNLETKLRQEVRRFCFNVLLAFALMYKWGCGGRDRMVVGFTTTCSISAYIYHHQGCEFECCWWWDVFDKVSSDLRQVGGFLWFPQPIKLTAMI